jgi:hypothetical protein
MPYHEWRPQIPSPSFRTSAERALVAPKYPEVSPTHDLADLERRVAALEERFRLADAAELTKDRLREFGLVFPGDDPR